MHSPQPLFGQSHSAIDGLASSCFPSFSCALTAQVKPINERLRTGLGGTARLALDLVEPEEREARIERFAGAIGMKKGERPLAISGATGEGLRPMLEAAWRLSEKA